MRALASCFAVLSLVVAVLAGSACWRPAFAATGAAYCAAGVGGHRIAAPVPTELAPAVAGVFGISVDIASSAATVRCVGDKLMACWVGANLDCGQANRSRSLPGASAYCRDDPGADSIPMVATGHDTIYLWRCVGRRAVVVKTDRAVDARGYIADNWREVP
jgi:hypothetical protein